MSWFSGSGKIEPLIERATSESIPAGEEDIALNLEISDHIKSKSVPARAAMKTLKRRLSHRNANVQLLTLKLTDTCIKNGGDHFLVEIASREFIDNLTSLIRASSTSSVVISSILELLQLWALAFEGRPQLGYVNTVYRELKSEGFDFPSAPKITSTFIDTAAPPEWGDSDVCMRCRTPFSMTNRKHHCRNCGQTFDAPCTSHMIPLPRLGIMQPVRVCDGCYYKLNERKQSNTTGKSHSSSMQPRDAKVDDTSDADLKLALELSLNDIPDASKVPKKTHQESDDEDLKTAIAASLRDVELLKNKTPPSSEYTISKLTTSGISYPSLSEPQIYPMDYKTVYQIPQPQQKTQKGYNEIGKYESTNELSSVDIENLNLFSTMIERMRTAPPGAILRDPKIQELYESVNLLRPKLNFSLSSVIDKYESFIDLHAKLSIIVRNYDKLLEDRLNYTYSTSTYCATNPRPVVSIPQSARSSDQLTNAPPAAVGSTTGTEQQPSAPQQSPHPSDTAKGVSDVNLSIAHHQHTTKVQRETAPSVKQVTEEVSLIDL